MKLAKNIWCRMGGGGDIIQFTPALRKYWKLNKDKRYIRLIVPERALVMKLSEHIPYCHERAVVRYPNTYLELFEKYKSQIEIRTRKVWAAYDAAVKEMYTDITTGNPPSQDNCRVQRLASFIPIELKDEEKQLEVFITEEDRLYAMKLFADTKLDPEKPTLIIARAGGRIRKNITVSEARGVIKHFKLQNWQKIEIGPPVLYDYSIPKEQRVYKMGTFKCPQFTYGDISLTTGKTGEFHARISAALLELCDGIICPDSTMLFIALALDKPVWSVRKRFASVSPSNFNKIPNWEKRVKMI